MNRIDIYHEDEEGQRVWAGWFDQRSATTFRARREYDRNGNKRDANTRDEWSGQRLYHTAGGRWVLWTWTSWQGSDDRWEFIDDEAARDWLIANDADEAVERYFGAPPEPERGPGQPPIGPPVLVRMYPEMIAALDAEAQARQTTRAAVVRDMLMSRLFGEPAGVKAGRLSEEL